MSAQNESKLDELVQSDNSDIKNLVEEVKQLVDEDESNNTIDIELTDNLKNSLWADNAQTILQVIEAKYGNNQDIPQDIKNLITFLKDIITPTSTWDESSDVQTWSESVSDLNKVTDTQTDKKDIIDWSAFNEKSINIENINASIISRIWWEKDLLTKTNDGIQYNTEVATSFLDDMIKNWESLKTRSEFKNEINTNSVAYGACVQILLNKLWYKEFWEWIHRLDWMIWSSTHEEIGKFQEEYNKTADEQSQLNVDKVAWPQTIQAMINKLWSVTTSTAEAVSDPDWKTELENKKNATEQAKTDLDNTKQEYEELSKNISATSKKEDKIELKGKAESYKNAAIEYQDSVKSYHETVEEFGDEDQIKRAEDLITEANKEVTNANEALTKATNLLNQEGEPITIWAASFGPMDISEDNIKTISRNLNWATLYSTNILQNGENAIEKQTNWNEYYAKMPGHPDKIYKIKVDQQWNICPIATEVDLTLQWLEVTTLLWHNRSCMQYLASLLPGVTIGRNENVQDYTITSYNKTLTIEPMTIAWDWVSDDLSICLKLLNFTNYLTSWQNNNLDWKDPDLRIKKDSLEVKIDKQSRKASGGKRWGAQDLKMFWFNDEDITKMKEDRTLQKFIRYNNHEGRNDDRDDKRKNKVYKKI